MLGTIAVESQMRGLRETSSEIRRRCPHRWVFIVPAFLQRKYRGQRANAGLGQNK
jgi:hypothetical protein